MEPTLLWSNAFKYEFEGYINVTTEEEYTFYYNLEGRARLTIDDTEVLNLMEQCYEWIDDDDDNQNVNKNSITLSVGLHKFYVKGYASPFYDYSTNQYYRMKIKYSTASDSTIRSIPLVCGIYYIVLYIFS